MTLSSAGSDSSRRTAGRAVGRCLGDDDTLLLLTTDVWRAPPPPPPVVVVVVDGRTILRDKIQWCSNRRTMMGSIRTGRLLRGTLVSSSSPSPPCARGNQFRQPIQIDTFLPHRCPAALPALPPYIIYTVLLLLGFYSDYLQTNTNRLSISFSTSHLCLTPA